MKPAYACSVEYLTFTDDTAPGALRKVADYLAEHPRLSIDHRMVGPIAVEYDEDDELFRVSIFGDANDNVTLP